MIVTSMSVIVLSFVLAIAPNVTFYILLKAIIQILKTINYIAVFLIGELTEKILWRIRV